MLSLLIIFLSFTGFLSVQPVNNPTLVVPQPVQSQLTVQASPDSSQLLQPTYDPQQ